MRPQQGRYAMGISIMRPQLLYVQAAILSLLSFINLRFFGTAMLFA
jgi:hypothetical protein